MLDKNNYHNVSSFACAGALVLKPKMRLQLVLTRGMLNVFVVQYLRTNYENECKTSC